jgi:hypothetical protein
MKAILIIISVVLVSLLLSCAAALYLWEQLIEPRILQSQCRRALNVYQQCWSAAVQQGNEASAAANAACAPAKDALQKCWNNESECEQECERRCSTQEEQGECEQECEDKRCACTEEYETQLTCVSEHTRMTAPMPQKCDDALDFLRMKCPAEYNQVVQ